MKTEKENIDLIERYLDDKLSPEELDLFQEKMNSDREFNKLFFEMDRLVQGIKLSAGKTSIEEKLANLEKSLPFQKSKREEAEETPVIILWSYVKQYKLPVAAVFALIFATTFVFTISDFNKDPGKLYASLYSKNFEAYENYGPLTQRSPDGDIKREEEALLYYDQGNYEKALEIFKQLDPETTSSGTRLYFGNTYMALGDTENAKVLFQKNINENTGFIRQTRWYLALCYLKEGNIDEAVPLFREVVEKQGKFKKTEAAKILAKID